MHDLSLLTDLVVIFAAAVRSRYQGEVAHLHALAATHVIAAEVEAGRTITEQVLRRSIPAGELR